MGASRARARLAPGLQYSEHRIVSECGTWLKGETERECVFTPRGSISKSADGYQAVRRSPVARASVNCFAEKVASSRAIRLRVVQLRSIPL